ncbi:hypothetical protein, partial [Agrococcus sp. Ld7]|uniref:hypothetical protein n=1 Tax=Agrococcus sp. Ld7 TaxID=649148 RepID=UPI00386FF2BF
QRPHEPRVSASGAKPRDPLALTRTNHGATPHEQVALRRSNTQLGHDVAGSVDQNRFEDHTSRCLY